jgi:hypothetical protein
MSTPFTRRTRSLSTRAALCAASLPTLAHAQQTFIDYIGPANSNWNNVLNWQGNNVPNVAGEVPLLHGHVRVTLDTSIVVDKIGIDHPLATIAINNGQVLGILTMNDGIGTTGLFGGGRYEINATSAGTYLRVYGGADSWAIFGSIVEPDPSVMILSSSGNAIVDATTTNAMLFNEGRIEGAGQLGANSLRIRNGGIIAATHPTALTMDAASGGNTNTGDMRAEGGYLQLLNGTFDNTDGEITLSNLPNSIVDFNGAVTIAGEIRAEPGATGSIRGYNGSQFHACAFNAPLDILNGHLVYLNNDSTIGASGLLRLGGSSAGTFIRILNNLTLSGEGGIRTTNTQNNVIDANVTNLVLTNDLVGGISGSMQLTQNSLRVVNNTFIAADGSAGMTVDAPSGGFQNNGQLWARAGSTLQLLNGTFTNPGSINAEAGGLCQINGCGIIGGTLSAAAGGAISSFNGSTLADVTVAAGTALSVPNGHVTHLQGTTTNAGTMTLSGSSAGTHFRSVSNITLNGPGVLSSTNTQNNVIDASAVNQVLTNNSTIRGSMQLAQNSLIVVNNGLVEAVGTNGITFDIPGGGSTNNGVIRAAADSSFTFLNGTLTNADGEIESAATVNLNGAAIIGGVLRSVGGAFSSFNNSTIQGITLDGTLAVPNGHLTHLNLAAINNGTLRLDGSSAGTYFRVNTAEFALTGTGEILTSNTQNNVIDSSVVGHRLVNNQTIRGSMQLCQNSLRLINNGLVEAQGSGGITHDIPDAHPTDNNGVIRAAAGSSFTVLNGPMDNADGVLESLGVINFSSGRITGGTLRTSGAGAFSSYNSSILHNVLLEGTLAVPNGHLTYLQGTITNNGAMHLSGSSAGTYFRTIGNVMLAGTGTVDLTNTQNNVFDSNTANEVLTIQGVTIQGACQIGQNSLGIINRGTILASASGGITIDPPGTAGFVNDAAGTLAAQGGNIGIITGPFTNAGTVRIDAGRLIDRNPGDFPQTAGDTLVHGELQVSGSFFLQGGTLTGTGLVDTNVINSGGTLTPGAGEGSGTLAIEGTYTQSTGGAMAIDLGGSLPGEWDRLTVTAAASLNGVLHVRFRGGFAPSVGSTFRIIDAASRTGTFSSVTSEGAPGLAGNVIYDTTGASLVMVPACGNSDFNGDGDFGTDQDIESFFACLAGNCCPTCFPGGSDFNADGDFGTDQDIEAFFRVLAGGPC